MAEGKSWNYNKKLCNPNYNFHFTNWMMIFDDGCNKVRLSEIEGANLLIYANDHLKKYCL
jgi:hypothetical protein